jgi:hypothetical protein
MADSQIMQYKNRVFIRYLIKAFYWNFSNVQHTCTTQMYNTPVQHKCTTHLYNTSVQHTLQHTRTTYLYNTPVQHTLQHKCTTHMYNTPVQHTCTYNSLPKDEHSVSKHVDDILKIKLLV